MNTKSLSISQSDFTKIGFSGVKVKNTNLQIQESTFSNSLKTTGHRLLSSQSINDAKLSQPIQFIVLDSSNSTLTNVSFTENSLNTLVDGGGVQIIGSGGVHILTDCIFENNQASNGGALFVKGQANSITILNSQFESNQASKYGGALTFSDQSISYFGPTPSFPPRCQKYIINHSEHISPKHSYIGRCFISWKSSFSCRVFVVY